MSSKTFTANVDASGAVRADETAPVLLAGSVDTTDLVAATELVDSADVLAAIAAAQLIGAGDASAEIDTIDTDFTAYKAAVDDVLTEAAAVVAAMEVPGGAVSGDIVLVVDGDAVVNLNRLKAALNAFYSRAAGSGFLAEG